MHADALHREEQDLAEALERGDLTLKEYNREMLELQRAYQNAARERAQDAYDREMEEW